MNEDNIHVTLLVFNVIESFIDVDLYSLTGILSYCPTLSKRPSYRSVNL